MDLTLYYHPFSSFCQKALIALYEAGTAFEPRLIDLADPDQRAELASLWPLAKFPVLRDARRDRTVPESSLIVAYVDQFYGGQERLIPLDFDAALHVHLLDRLMDGGLFEQVTKVVTDSFRPEDGHDLIGIEQAKARIATTYDMLERELNEDDWLAGDDFTLADCAAAPGIFYAGTVVPFRDHPRLSAYYDRLMARPSVARVIDEARPYRQIFPLPWPKDYA